MTEWAGKCRGCKWWECELPEQYTFGFCHRHPPQTEKHVAVKNARFGEGGELTITDTRQPAWPNTAETDWCGEWAERHAPLPQRLST